MVSAHERGCVGCNWPGYRDDIDVDRLSEQSLGYARNDIKNQQMGSHQTKKLLHSNKTTNGMKRNPIKCKKVFSSFPQKTCISTEMPQN